MTSTHFSSQAVTPPFDLNAKTLSEQFLVRVNLAVGTLVCTNELPHDGHDRQPSVGFRFHLRVDLGGFCLRGIRGGRLRPLHRGLEGALLHERGLRPGCPGAGHPRPQAQAGRWTDPPQRPWEAISVHPVQWTPDRRWIEGLDRERRRLLRQCHGRDDQRTVQDRSDPPQVVVAQPGGGRVGHIGMVDWFNNRRLLSSIGYLPPAEAEANYYAEIGSTIKV